MRDTENVSPTYKPGDAANGYVLTEQGEWVPTHGQPPVLDHTSARAQAKAAKAHAKAMRPFWRKKRAWVLASVAGIMVIGVISGAMSSGDTGGGAGSTPSSDKPAMSVKAVDILSEFEDNEAAADAKYDGQVLRVTGTIDKIDTELLDDDQYVVQIGGGSDFEIFTVNADDQSQADVASLSKGDKITVVGDFEDGGDLGVELAHAKIVG